MFLGVDIGGTFTDLVVMDDDGTFTMVKAATTPHDLAEGVFEAISLAAAQRGQTLDDVLPKVEVFGHGTTQATNALIERTGARTALLTTRGFRDTLLLQRLMGFTAGVPVESLGRYSARRYPEPLVPRGLIAEVPERVDHSGRVLLALDENATRLAVQGLAAQDVKAFAVCLLWSFRNSTHEERVGEIIREEVPDAYVSLSCEVSPVIGEYERTATTVLNSYLSPRVVEYLRNIEDRLRERGFTGAFRVLNSVGGVMPAREASAKPVLLLASGPTGGVIGSHYLATALGHRNVITTDMGGTSFDVGMIVDGRPLVSAKTEAGGYHLSIPMVEIRAVGSGGGSIAQVTGGLLRVGPESAGANPGPVCYRRGGARATVTDADVVLGILDPDNFLGGRMSLDLEGARAAIDVQIAQPLGLTVEEAAAGIRRVVDSQMADTLREVSIGRGHDPRDFVVYSYGGAGPAHCAGYGYDLGAAEIVVPVTSTVHSAYGALASDLIQTSERSLLLQGGGGPLPPWQGIDPTDLTTAFDELEAQARSALGRAGVDSADVEIRRSVDCRYRSQTHDLIVSLPEWPLDEGVVHALVERFERSYEDTYGKGAAFREAGIEITTARVEAIGQTRKPNPQRALPTGERSAVGGSGPANARYRRAPISSSRPGRDRSGCRS